jgi:small subunit ribosomal protein S8
MLDPISDMLTRIRNAQRAGKRTVEMPSSKLKRSVIKVMLDRGFVESFGEKIINGKTQLEIALKYRGDSQVVKEPFIHEIRRVSKEGQRMYVRSQDIKRIKNGLGTAIISTSKGVISGEEARKLGVGGEYICSIW